MKAERAKVSFELRNFARGGRGFHANRFAILRATLAGRYHVGELTRYLRTKLFQLPASGWRAYSFTRKDWESAGRLLTENRPWVEHALLLQALAYVASNIESVAKMYRMGDDMSGRILSNEAIELEPGTDLFTVNEAQSLFAFRVLCATHETSVQTMKDGLEKAFVRGGWCHSRLMFPLINLITNRRLPEELDDFLAYFATGDEFPAEKLALKLLLSDTAARTTPLSFKLYIGMMGHPFDVCDMILDHCEFALVSGEPFSTQLQHALEALAAVLPDSRADRLARAVRALPVLDRDPSEAEVAKAIAPFGLGLTEAATLAKFIRLQPLAHKHVANTQRPLVILANMRASDYPEPPQFQQLVAIKATWSFVDGGRLVSALMRSIYMVDRTSYDLEARDVLRLSSLFGGINPMLASAPSAMPFLRRLGESKALEESKIRNTESGCNAAIIALAPLKQRLWINELQWRLRRLEDEGRIRAWLEIVRSDARVKPLYLTGINWPWVEQIIEDQRLKPFRSFDGAFLLLLMEMESNSDPLRLKLVLDSLLAGLGFEDVVATILSEYGEKAPAILRRYLTSATLLSNGLAANHFAALDLRLKAIEEGVRQLGFGPLLTQEMWEAETKLLTSELLLLNVNAGKFEVPWQTFEKDVAERHSALFETFRNMSFAGSDEALTAFVDTPRIFKNGRKEQYRYRRNNSLLFQLILQVVEDFLDHPAFGLEVILSGRFRHNNILQELQAALASVEAMAIPPVTDKNKRLLIAAYRPILERQIYDWCTRRLHSKRADKPDALFDLVPSQDEMAHLLAAASENSSFEDLVRQLTEWLKAKLRIQVVAAGAAFVSELRSSLTVAFDSLRDEQIATAYGVYRPDDARKIHGVVLDAILRRVDELEPWFDGVDTTTAQHVTLDQLANAAERLFENLLPGRCLEAQLDAQSCTVSFEPAEVKVAFDLIRELAFNALKHGPTGKITLNISRQPECDPVAFEFANKTAESATDSNGTVHGHRYDSPHEALTRDKNSGRLKVAASAATLTGGDIEVKWRREGDRYAIVVPLRRSQMGKAP